MIKSWRRTEDSTPYPFVKDRKIRDRKIEERNGRGVAKKFFIFFVFKRGELAQSDIEEGNDPFFLCIESFCLLASRS